MAAKQSAGVLLFRRTGGPGGGGLEVLLVHPGGPFWARKDDGAWSIPKGEYGAPGELDGEEALEAAVREFEEETGHPVPAGDRLELGTLKQPGGKVVAAWAVEGSIDADAITSNTFELEWPPRSGKRASFPEVDRAGWFGLPEARTKILKGQAEFLDRLTALLG
ncbi:MAG TPA: NUDIX domain-containing protein [Actinocrinis sp.]|jgi:predicted NUDIX family NTP pyrophosphohydrolase|uniref:NUDIX domain-containing protein n=1 Tax=Actinocrinis sp. TaxID=1920516 RepID=UPI002DDD6E1D|nr:NUDIX domain-containing protein [Actinocrinis sp.]HEV3170921.1 NUDIX domain-containing protein [Actinocrinis sp.]